MELNSLKKKFAFYFNKYYIGAIILVVLIILAGGYFLFINKIVTEIQDIGVADLHSREQVLKSYQNTLKQLEALQEQYARITKNEKDQLNSILPTEAEIPELIIEIKEFIKKNELALLSISTGSLGSLRKSEQAASTSADFRELNLSITVSGINSYFKLKSFLDNISVSLPLLELHSLSYDPGAESYTLNLTTYYQ